MGENLLQPRELTNILEKDGHGFAVQGTHSQQ
jgi:hypothetical protein